MGIVGRNKQFVVAAALIVLGGLFIMSLFTVFFAMAQDETGAATTTQTNYNLTGSYGLTGFPDLKLEPTDETPKAIRKRLKEKRPIALLVYCKGAGADMSLKSSFQSIARKYAADMSFFKYESKQVKHLGDVLTQLEVSDPPICAIVRSDGSVAELYTGWVGYKVLDQQVADAVRGF